MQRDGCKEIFSLTQNTKQILLSKHCNGDTQRHTVPWIPQTDTHGSHGCSTSPTPGQIEIRTGCTTKIQTPKQQDILVHTEQA